MAAGAGTAASRSTATCPSPSGFPRRECRSKSPPSMISTLPGSLRHPSPTWTGGTTPGGRLPRRSGTCSRLSHVPRRPRRDARRLDRIHGTAPDRPPPRPSLGTPGTAVSLEADPLPHLPRTLATLLPGASRGPWPDPGPRSVAPAGSRRGRSKAASSAPAAPSPIAASSPTSPATAGIPEAPPVRQRERVDVRPPARRSGCPSGQSAPISRPRPEAASALSRPMGRARGRLAGRTPVVARVLISVGPGGGLEVRSSPSRPPRRSSTWPPAPSC